jgi:hypothetical protein
LGSGCIAPRILELVTKWRLVVSFTLRPLYLQGKSPWYHWVGGWVGPRAILATVVKRKILSPFRASNPRSFSPWPSAIPLSYPGSLSCIIICNYFDGIIYTTRFIFLNYCFRPRNHTIIVSWVLLFP